MGDVFIGVDPDSTRLTALVSKKDWWTVRRKILPPPQDVPTWCDAAWVWVYRLVKKYKDEGHRVHFFVEKPFVSKFKPSAAIPLSRLNGACLAAAHRAGADTVLDVTIQSWKKEVVGKGDATKPEVATWCKVYWRLVWDEAQKLPASQGRQDVCDAAAINRYGVKNVKKQRRVRKFYKMNKDAKPKTIAHKKLVKK